jgi:hypothetical protein
MANQELRQPVFSEIERIAGSALLHIIKRNPAKPRSGVTGIGLLDVW